MKQFFTRIKKANSPVRISKEKLFLRLECLKAAIEVRNHAEGFGDFENLYRTEDIARLTRKFYELIKEED